MLCYLLKCFRIHNSEANFISTEKKLGKVLMIVRNVVLIFQNDSLQRIYVRLSFHSTNLVKITLKNCPKSLILQHSERSEIEFGFSPEGHKTLRRCIKPIKNNLFHYRLINLVYNSEASKQKNSRISRAFCSLLSFF